MTAFAAAGPRWGFSPLAKTSQRSVEKPNNRLARRFAPGLLIALGLVALPAAAQTLSGTMLSQIQLTAGCMIAGSSGGATGVNFGLLDFGTWPSTFVGVATATASGGEGVAGPTQIVCSPDVLGINIEVGPGSYEGLGGAIGSGARAMRNGSVAAYLPYDVYRDPSYLQAYPTAAAVTGIPVPANGAAFALPIYGRVNKTDPVALPAGVYSDTLQITLTY